MKLGLEGTKTTSVDEAFDVGFRHLTTADKIRRDRDVHRLGLHHIAGLSRDTLIKVLQDVCIHFEIRDVRNLPVALLRCIKVLAAIPELEKFVTDVCDVVLDDDSGRGVEASTNPMAVPIILKDWKMQLSEKEMLSDMRGAVLEILRRRPGRGENDDDAKRLEPEFFGTTVAISKAISELVEHESLYMLLQSRLSDAEAVLLANPEDFFVKVVKHFQLLFCPAHADTGVDGIIPVMNHVHNSLAEVTNLLRWLRSVLGMPGDAPTNAVARRLHQIFSATRKVDNAPAPAPAARSAASSQPHESPQEEDQDKKPPPMPTSTTAPSLGAKILDGESDNEQSTVEGDDADHNGSIIADVTHAAAESNAV